MIPQLRDWHAKYETQGLTIVGVHTPEFFWEKPIEKVDRGHEGAGGEVPGGAGQ